MALTEEKPLQVVDKDGNFNLGGLESFVKICDLARAGTQYQVVSIMGPQSSGKSTLLNSLFGTDFRMMNADQGRSQTTQGIWLARAPKMENCTLLLDLEGSDGRERGEDDTSFEKQSALFALALSDVLMVNIWCHDIGREQGSGKPLMKTVLQVHLKLMQEDKKTVLVFVIRDKGRKTPQSALEVTLADDLSNMWNSIPKPPHVGDRPLEDFFDVKYVSLPNYEEKEEDFKAEAVVMRGRFYPDHENSFVKPESKLPGSVLPMSAERLWATIHSHKDLNLPAHKVMVANIRCKEIMSEKLARLQEDQAWEAVCSGSEQDIVPDFGSTVSGLVDSCIAGYKEEAQYFDLGVCQQQRRELVAALVQLALPLVRRQHSLALRKSLEVLNGHLDADTRRAGATFAEAMREGLEAARALSASLLESSRVEVDGGNLLEAEEADAAAKASKELQGRAERARSERVEATCRAVEERALGAVAEVASGLLEDMPLDLWPALRRAVEAEVNSARSELERDLREYESTSEEIANAVLEVRAKLRDGLQKRARDAASHAIYALKNSFNAVFNFEANGVPRVWGARDNISKITGDARASAAVCLSQLAVMRLDEATDRAAVPVEGMLLEGLVDRDSPAPGSEPGRNPLAVSKWPGVPEGAVLLQPPACRSVWRQFRSETDFAVSNARNTQQAHQMASNRSPPMWALAAILVLGFDEFVGFLYNPLYMLLGIVFVLFARQLYVELDVDNEMQKGALPGLISISSKAVPVARRVSANTFDAVSKLVAGEDGIAARVGLTPPRNPERPGEVEMHRRAGTAERDGRDGPHRRRPARGASPGPADSSHSSTTAAAPRGDKSD